MTSYPERLGVIKSRNHHQALRCKQFRVLNYSWLLVCLVSIASINLLQLNTEEKQMLSQHQAEMKLLVFSFLCDQLRETVSSWRSSHLWTIQALPESKAGTVVTLRVYVSQHGNEEGGRLPLWNQLPTAGLAKLEWRRERRWWQQEG